VGLAGEHAADDLAVVACGLPNSVDGQMRVSGRNDQNGEANLSFLLSGLRGRAQVLVSATLERSTWMITMLDVRPGKRGVLLPPCTSRLVVHPLASRELVIPMHNSQPSSEGVAAARGPALAARWNTWVLALACGLAFAAIASPAAAQ